MDINFDEYFSSVTPIVAIVPLIENIIITVFLAFLLAVVYNKYGSTLLNRKQFSKFFILVYFLKNID